MNRSTCMLLLTAMSLLPAVATATEDIAWLRNQLRDTTVELRRLEDEHVALQAKLAAAEQATRKAVEAARAAGGEKPRAVSRELARLQSDLDATTQQLAALEARAVAAEQLAAVATAERKAQHDGFAATRRAIGECEADNRTLAATGNALLAQLRDDGFWASVVRREPLTGIARSRYEALLEKYRTALRAGDRAAAAGAAPGSGQ